MIATPRGRSELSSGVAPHMDVPLTGATGFVGANVARHREDVDLRGNKEPGLHRHV